MLNGNGTASSYAEQLETFKRADAARDVFIQDLLRNYEELQTKYSEKCDDYNNEVESRRMWYRKATSNEQALKEQQKASGSSSFVMAVLDGDGAIFQDFLYALGKEGGDDAAHQLHAELKNQLKAIYPDDNVADWSICVQVYLNLHGLALKLHACGIVSSPNEIYEFGRGFSRAQPFFSFVDVGSGKERADYKVRETLRLFLPNAQCKHVFFGPCSDNGYAPTLDPYKRDYASRLTLIETRPAESEFVNLGLNRVRFPRVFRSDNLPTKPPIISPPSPVSRTPPATTPARSSSIQMQPNCAPFVPQVPSPAPSSDSGTSSNTWATIGKNGTTAKTINVASKKPPPLRPHLLLNVYEERVDAELPKSDGGAEKRFSERLKSSGKFCNNFHLLGRCDSGDYCDYNHGDRLTPGEQLVLKHKARSRSCPKKSACRDLNCTYGHHCKFGKDCTLLNDCWFVETHGMDTQAAKRYFEDDTDEWMPQYLAKFQCRLNQ